MTVSVEQGVQIRRVEVADSSDFRAVHAVLAQVDRASYPEAPEAFSYRELLYGSDDTRWGNHLYLAAFRDGDCVGVVSAVFPLVDNRTHVFVELGVLPDARRAGVGSQLHAGLVQECRRRGRSQLLTEVKGPCAASATDPAAWHPGARFAERRGLTVRNVDVQRRLALPVPVDRLDELDRRAAERLGSYRIESWVGRVPADYRGQYARLLAQLMTDAPTGTLEIEPMQVDRERLEYEMGRRERMGREPVVAVAVAPDRRLVGQSELTMAQDPSRTECFQGNTLVFAEHRGHSLGLALKVAMHRELARHAPQAGWCHTLNSEVNTHMIAINDLLGYAKVGWTFEYQGPVR